MAKSTKSYEERMLEMEKKEQESLEKAKRYATQKKELLKRKKAEESKKRTHRLCQIGGAVESVLGAPIEEEDIPKLIGFLKRQEANGKFFSKAMQKEAALQARLSVPVSDKLFSCFSSSVSCFYIFDIIFFVAFFVNYTGLAEGLKFQGINLTFSSLIAIVGNVPYKC